MDKIDYKIFMYGSSKYYDDYMNYYINGIRYLGISFKETPTVSDIAPLSFGRDHDQRVGQYIIRFTNGKQIKWAIDAHDDKAIRSKKIYDWSDIYFKCNYWPLIKYPVKVAPMVNGVELRELKN